MKNKVVLVICGSNWADEMDVDGFALVEEGVWDEHLRLVKEKIFKGKGSLPYDDSGDHVVCIGTNESICYETFVDYKADFKVKYLTEDEVRSLSRLFGLKVNKDPGCISNEFGMFTSLSPARIEEEEEDDGYEEHA